MGLFITFEGPEGCGKSTQARLLYERLHMRGYPVILTREPGGTRIGDLIRRIVLDLQHTEMAPTTEALLFSAARAQLVSQVIRPYLEQGGIVICDRYADSTYAYQGHGLGRDMAELQAITAIATSGLQPDITIYLDLSAQEGLERKRRKQQEHTELARPSLNSVISAPEQTSDSAVVTPTPIHQPRDRDPSPPVEWNRLDARELTYHERVEAGYRSLIARDPARWQTFDARQTIEELLKQIEESIEPYLEHIQLLEPAPLKDNV